MPDLKDTNWMAGPSTIGGIAVVVIGAIAAGFHIFMPRPPLVSLRPSVEMAWYPSGAGEQAFASRLWQDPLGVAAEARKDLEAHRDLGRTEPEPVGVDRPGRIPALEPIAAQADGKPALVLPVLVSSQPYGEIEESRLRTRYAVLSALGAAHYVPEDREHIGVYRPAADDGVTGDLLIPFEWYKAVQATGGEAEERPAFGRVLVLWVDEDELGSKPLEGLVAITRRLRGEGDINVHCLGPTNSDTLLAIANEFKQGPGVPSWMTIYSPWATISPTQIKDRLGEEPDRRRLQRTVATDDTMCEALVKELVKRRVDPDGGDRIALITEWDTLYGQCLVPTFKEAAKGAWSEKQDNVVSFTYMRGLDGKPPGQQQSEGKPPVTGSSENAPPPNAESPPAGKSQVDYLQRLDRHLREMDEGYRRSGGGRLRAIGVLGSDLYDKLLVLRALRPSFPGAIFFTTDLDARLLLASEFPWTRNMIVASPFGLELCQDVQCAAPPFRDCHQCSAYVATLRALEAGKCTCNAAPCIFEIGRHGAYDLSAGTQVYPHPPTVWTRNWLNLRRLALLAVLVATSGVLSIPLVAWPARKRWRSRTLWIGVAALVIPLGTIALLIALDQSSMQGEPFLVFHGISSWPTEVLRALALSLSIIFIIAIGASLKASTRKLTDSYFKTAQEDQTHRGQAQEDRGKLSFVRRAWQVLVPFGPSRADSVESLWKEFIRRGNPWHRVVRVTLGVVLFVSAYFLLFTLLDSVDRPVRGDFNDRVDKLTLLFSVLGMLALLSLVLDVTALCDWFARELFGGGLAGQWPDGRMAEEAKRQGLPPARLNSWQSIKLVAEHTEVVGRFIYYPFIVILILLISRHPVFEGWLWPPPLIIVFLSLFGTATAAAVMLRASAKRAQARIVRGVRREAALLDGLEDKRRERQALLALATEVEEEHRGAFSRVLESPVLRAVLIPSVGIGAVKLLEFFTATMS